ncbi:MAG: AAC(3) family N-acetyltransferase [Anaerolineales bacterium]
MTDITYMELSSAFASLELTDVPVVAHASLHAFGRVDGGPATFVQALLQAVGALIMPTHTYNTMITPNIGPANNAMIYGSGQDLNRMAEFYSPSMPADRLMGVVPEALRQRPEAKRSIHPILSFAGIRANKAIASQTMDEPFAPIRMLAEAGGWVLLLGVDHTVNTTVHYAEKLAGRRQFIRWALTENGIIACSGFPGDSSGFKVLEKDLQPHTKKLQVGNALVQAMPMKALLLAVMTRLKNNPKDLLCSDISCARCNEIRR